MPDDYTYKPSKGLKFKGEEGVKKKKKSSSTTPKPSSSSQIPSKELAVGPSSSYSPSDTRTESEKKFDAIQRQRLHQKVKKDAKLSHKDKVDQFNKKLESLTEHNDLPKIGPG